MTRLQPFVAAIGTSLCFLLVAPGAHAGELIANGHFDTDVSGWNNQFHASDFEFSWDSTDVDASANSGSLHNTTTITSSVLDGPLYCVALGPGSYQAAGSILIPPQMPAPSGAIMLIFWDRPNCTLDSLGNPTSDTVADDGAWHQVMVEGVAPTGTQGVSVELASGGTTDPTPVSAYFDDVSLVAPEPGELSTALAAIGVLAGVRRARTRASRRPHSR
jgi:hypothetical protein